MYEVQDWAEVHRLFHRGGWAKKKIAEELGMSRNTVTRLLELTEPPQYERKSTGSKLDAYKGSIAKMLDVDPTVSARVILEHLRPEGYEGGITILKDYLQEVRPLFLGARSYQRTSYLPGSWRIPTGGSRRCRFRWVRGPLARPSGSLPPFRTRPPTPRCSAFPSRQQTSCRRWREHCTGWEECQKRW